MGVYSYVSMCLVWCACGSCRAPRSAHQHAANDLHVGGEGGGVYVMEGGCGCMGVWSWAGAGQQGRHSLDDLPPSSRHARPGLRSPLLPLPPQECLPRMRGTAQHSPPASPPEEGQSPRQTQSLKIPRQYNTLSSHFPSVSATLPLLPLTLTLFPTLQELPTTERLTEHLSAMVVSRPTMHPAPMVVFAPVCEGRRAGRWGWLVVG